jgi:peptide/nickel transport system permease protein
MIQQGQSFYRTAPWLVTFPGLAIMLTVFAFNLFGDGLRDALDPTQRGRG